MAVTRIRFPFSPQIVMITIHEINSASSQPLISGPWIRGMSNGRLIVQPVAYSNNNYVNLSWDGNALSFYSTKDANYQLNLKDGIYYFFAIGWGLQVHRAGIRFPFLPKLVIIRNMVLMRGTDVTFHSTSSNGSSSGNAKNTAIWTETGVEWYCSQSYQPSAASQMNAEGVVYNYLAIG